MLNIPIESPTPSLEVRDEYRVWGLTSCITLDDYKRWCESKTPLEFAKILYIIGGYKYL